MKNMTKELSLKERDELVGKLKARFEENKNRHKGIDWAKILPKLDSKKLLALKQMEETGGEPDVVVLGKETVFCDCSKETPKGRVSLCYDADALKSRKEFKPKNNAISLAESMGVEILTEEQYRELQKIGEFDLKTSSWVKTPADIRKLGGALFCDRRYNTVFTYHNGAESYYAARGFRASLKI
ncbi:DUF4256 domain-containing protein [Candidatus Micrarchaeota archaeon]|nr:DUF4256 domain-containing protein [Candidatus Micrarchaeota archaeon]